MVTIELLDYGIDAPSAKILDGDAVKRISEYRQIFIEPGMEQERLTCRLYWRLPFWRILTTTRPQNRYTRRS